MASNLTLKTDLDTFCPVYNPMEICIYQADGVTLALTDYKYIFDVYIEGVSSPAYKRYEVIPDSVLSYGTVDISRYCEGYVYNALEDPTSTAPFLMAANAIGQSSVIKVTVKYGYSYMNSGVYTVVADSVVGSAKYVWNGSLDWQQWVDNFDYTDYICNITNGVNGQWLTKLKTHNVSIANIGRMCVLTDTPTDVDYVVYKTYNSAGTLIQTATKLITVAQNLTVSRMYKVATGPETINNITGAWVTGAQPVITSSVYYYTIQLTNSASAVASEILTFNIEEPCRYTQRRLHFINQLGGWEAFNFDLKSTERRDVERKGYKYDKYPVVSAGISRSVSDQSQVINYVATQDFIKLTSEFITESENDLIKELIESPEIYLEITDYNGNQNYFAVESIVGTSWSEKQTASDKLFTAEVEIKISQKNYRQRR